MRVSLTEQNGLHRFHIKTQYGRMDFSLHAREQRNSSLKYTHNRIIKDIKNFV